MENINLVCDYDNLAFIKKIDNYQMDLGKTYTSKNRKNELVIDIKDDFVSIFYDKYNTFIYKNGVIGGINIYTCTTVLDKNTLMFYYKDKFKTIENISLNQSIDINETFKNILIDLFKDND